MKYIDTITPELREQKRVRCLVYNSTHREEIKQKQKWTYYNLLVGKDLVKEYIDIYGEDAKTHLREYVRLHPKPKI
jgi:predicted nucleotidyltransferase